MPCTAQPRGSIVPPEDPLIGQTLADRYRIVAPIGRGGAGSVYRAVQIQLEREVAVKVIRADLSARHTAELEQRFVREAALAGRLKHPHIVRVIDYGVTDDDMAYVVMELLDGSSLKEWFRAGPKPVREVARVGAALARGLQHAHGAGLIHRDVKLSNVLMVTDDDGVEQPVLVDFGLVKLLDNDLELTRSGTYLGTPLYMSPEQASGELVLDPRSDIYSLGCVLFALVSGTMPFRADGPMQTALMHVNAPIPALADRDVQVSPEFEAVIRKCLAKNKDERWANAGLLAKALDGFAVAEGSTAPPPQVPANKPAWVVPLVGGMGLLGLLGLGVGVLGVAGLVAAGWMASELDKPPAFEPDTPFIEAPVSPPPPEPTPAQVPSVAEPAPAELPVVEPAPAPAPQVRATPSPRPEPATVKPKPAPKQAAPSGGDSRLIEGVRFPSAAHRERALSFINSARGNELFDAGIYARGVNIIKDHRPFDSLEAFASTKGIGEKTIRALRDHTK